VLFKKRAIDSRLYFGLFGFQTFYNLVLGTVALGEGDLLLAAFRYGLMTFCLAAIGWRFRKSGHKTPP